MISMGDSRYVYRPISEEKRAKMAAAHRKRLGIPDGHFIVYGHLFSERHKSFMPGVLKKIYDKHGKDEAIMCAKVAARVCAKMDGEQPIRE